MSNKEQVKVLDVTPDSLQQDKQILDMSEAIQPSLDDVNESMSSIEIYSRIDELPEAILRMLALEHRVYQDEWELAQTIEAKRRLIKDSFALNKKRGTRWSIERIFDLLNITATLQEWFEYGGDPFKFKVAIYEIEGRGLTESEIATANRLIQRYKPLRSALESIDISIKADDVSAYSFAFTTTTIVIDVEPQQSIIVNTDTEIFSGAAGTMKIIATTYEN